MVNPINPQYKPPALPFNSNIDPTEFGLSHLPDPTKWIVSPMFSFTKECLETITAIRILLGLICVFVIYNVYRYKTSEKVSFIYKYNLGKKVSVDDVDELSRQYKTILEKPFESGFKQLVYLLPKIDKLVIDNINNPDRDKLLPKIDKLMIDNINDSFRDKMKKQWINGFCDQHLIFNNEIRQKIILRIASKETTPKEKIDSLHEKIDEILLEVSKQGLQFEEIVQQSFKDGIKSLIQYLPKLDKPAKRCIIKLFFEQHQISNSDVQRKMQKKINDLVGFKTDSEQQMDEFNKAMVDLFTEELILNIPAIEQQKWGETKYKNYKKFATHQGQAIFKEVEKFIKRLENYKDPLSYDIFKSQSTKKYLQDKVLKVNQSNSFLGSSDMKRKKKIINNIINDCSNLYCEAEERIKKDSKNRSLQRLDINQNDAIKEISPLGDESHNGGKIALSIQFDSGKKIVYKPRSLAPEKLICDEENGLLRYFGFGTYKIIDQGEYGYSEFLENKEEENLINTLEELQDYMDKIYILNCIGKKLGLGDLHAFNIITRNKQPCIIDAEVFLTPPNTEVGIYDDETASAFYFNDGLDNWAKNRLWFTSTFKTQYLKIQKFDFTSCMRKEELQSLGINIEGTKETQSKIKNKM